MNCNYLIVTGIVNFTFSQANNIESSITPKNNCSWFSSPNSGVISIRKASLLSSYFLEPQESFTVLKITVQFPLLLGIIKKPYLPAANSSPPMVTSLSKETVVFSLAPALQTLPYFYKPPQIVLPFTLGAP